MGIEIGLTAYDFIVVGLFMLFIGRGIWLGFLKQVTGLLALYFGYIVASQYHDKLFPFMREISENPKVGFWVGYIILFIGTYVVAVLIGKGLTRVVEVTIAVWFDRIIGALFGTAKAAIVVILLHMVLGTLMAPENEMLRKCQTCNGLNKATNFTLEFIQNEEIRESLMQKQPAISAEDVKDFFTKPPGEEPVPGEESAPIK